MPDSWQDADDPRGTRSRLGVEKDSETHGDGTCSGRGGSVQEHGRHADAVLRTRGPGPRGAPTWVGGGLTRPPDARELLEVGSGLLTQGCGQLHLLPF